MTFNISVQKLVCDSCNTMLTIPEFRDGGLKNNRYIQAESATRAATPESAPDSKEFSVEPENNTAGSDSYNGEDTSLSNRSASGITGNYTANSYICESCGGEITINLAETLSTCPFCGRRILFTDKIGKGVIRPDLIIPFFRDEKYFMSRLSRIISEQYTLYTSQVVHEDVIYDLNASIKAEYVPVWLYDVEAKAKVTAHTKNQNYYSSTDEDRKEICDGVEKAFFEKIPQDAVEDLDDDISRALEPYNFRNAVPFHYGYLTGLGALIYDVNAETGFENIKNRIDKSMHNEACFHYGADPADTKINDISYPVKRIKLAFIPVWTAHFTDVKNKSKEYRFTMNAQTGKMICNYDVIEPVISSDDFFLFVFGSFLPLFAAINVILTLINPILQIAIRSMHSTGMPVNVSWNQIIIPGAVTFFLFIIIGILSSEHQKEKFPFSFGSMKNLHFVLKTGGAVYAVVTVIRIAMMARGNISAAELLIPNIMFVVFALIAFLNVNLHKSLIVDRKIKMTATAISSSDRLDIDTSNADNYMRKDKTVFSGS